MTLFLLFRSTAGDVIPSCLQLSGQLLDKADLATKKRLMEALRGEYAVLASDGRKDESRDSVNGVNISVSGKVRPRSQLAMCTTHHVLAHNADISCRLDPSHSSQEGWHINVPCL